MYHSILYDYSVYINLDTHLLLHRSLMTAFETDKSKPNPFSVPVCPQTRQRQHPYQLKSANYPSIPALTSFSIFSLSDTPIHRHTIYTIFMQVVLLFSRLSYLKANARIYSIIIKHGIQLSVGTQRNIKIPKPDNYLRTCVGIFCIHMHICVHMIYTEWYIMSSR